MTLLVVLSIIIVFGFLTALAEMYREHRPRYAMIHTSPKHSMLAGKTISDALPAGEFAFTGYHAGTNKIREDIKKEGWTVTFGADKKLVGKICNRFSGSFTFLKNVLVAPQVISTKMACLEGNSMEMEQVFFSGLSHGFVVYKNNDKGFFLEDKETKAWFEIELVK